MLTRRFLAAMGVVALAAGLGACGDEVPGDGPSAAPTVAGPGAPSADDELQREADRVYLSFAGTKEQSAASGVVQAWAHNGAMDECMDAAGHPEWDWSAARNLGVSPASGLSTSTIFAPPLGLAFAEGAIRTRGFAEHEQRLMDDEPTGDVEAAIDSCLDHADRGPRATEVTEAEAAVKKLRNAWWGMAMGLDEYADLDAYDACFDPTGLDVLEETGQVPEELEVALSIAYPAASSQIPLEVDDPDASPEWKHAVALEQQYAEATWACRAEDYEAHRDEALADVLAFEVEHQDEIAAVATAWDAITARAVELGYDPATDTVTD